MISTWGNTFWENLEISLVRENLFIVSIMFGATAVFLSIIFFDGASFMLLYCYYCYIALLCC